MPEGDTILRAARALSRALAGRVVTRFETGLAQLSRVDRETPIAGRTVEEVRAAGKHLLLRFGGDLMLRTHLRMNGSWHLYRPGERWRRPRSAMRVVVETAEAVAVGFDLPVAELLTGAALARHPELSRLGPDLLGGAFDRGEAARRLRARGERTVAEALLDQSELAGVGNELKSEILFVAGVSPARTVASLADEELLEVLRVAERLLAINAGPAAGHGRRTTGRMNPRERLWVYGRAGKPCRRCGTAVAALRQGLGARVTYFCPRCQPGP